MPLDPALERVLARIGTNPVPLEDIEGRRQANRAAVDLLGRPRSPGVVVEDRQVPVAGGQITLRLLIPENLERPAPCLFFIHGGGWIMGSLEGAEADCVFGPDDVGAVFALVDYRLAPEHPFPTPYEDCLAAYRYLVDQHEELGIDLARLAISGGSAGANLGAAVAIAARDARWPQPCLQLLEVPAVDLTLSSPSVAEFSSGYGLTGEEVRRCVELYLGDDADRTDPRASPIFAELSGLPPAFIVVAELDPVRDDGERYAAALRAAGSEAACVRILGHLHGSWIIPGTPAWGVVRDMRLSVLRRAFAGRYAPSS
jgi:acetyl esterase